MVCKPKKGINMWAFPQDMPHAAAMKRAKELGFEGIELNVALHGECSLDSTDEEIVALKAAADEAGILVSSVCSGLFFQFSLTSARPDIRGRAMDLIRRQIDIAVLLGAEQILTVPGIVGADFAPEEVVPDVSDLVYYAGAEVVDYDVAYRRSLEAFRQLAPYAEERGIKIGIENIWGKFLLSPLEMRAFVDEIASPSVGVYFDIGNSMLVGYPEQWIKILGDRIICVHVKDFRRGTARLSGFVDLLSGDVDWVKVKEALNAAGYGGWCIAEMTPTYKSYPKMTAVQASAAMDNILGRI